MFLLKPLLLLYLEHSLHYSYSSYNINFKRVIERKLVMGIADGTVSLNGEEIYAAKDLRVGLFTDNVDS